jgi:hypothetical protein
MGEASLGGGLKSAPASPAAAVTLVKYSRARSTCPDLKSASSRMLCVTGRGLRCRLRSMSSTRPMASSTPLHSSRKTHQLTISRVNSNQVARTRLADEQCGVVGRAGRGVCIVRELE